MKGIRPLRCSVLLAMLALLICVFSPGEKMAAQAAGGSGSPQSQEFTNNVKEVYFPFNVYSRTIDPAVLDSDAEWLKQHPDVHFWIQGYADVRGDIVYNLVLSYRRAQWIKTFLINRGVSESQIGFATGWGKLYPVCSQDDPDCLQKNRRVDVMLPGLLM